MHVTDTVVIGAGHAGLATSRLLHDAGVDHVLLERGRLAERWRSESWDSLRLLTPNWMTRLPGWRYTGPHRDGYLSANGLVEHLRRYALSFGAPVHEGTTVLAVAPGRTGWRVDTDQGRWRARDVVVATGQCGTPVVPSPITHLHPSPAVVPARDYRRPAALPDGKVLVVGASSSGVQIADELARAGRDVVLSVGRHTRMPRTYRGRDVFWWLERTGRLARTIGEVRDAEAARREPSLQLVGRPRQDLDLTTLAARGVRLVGRLVGADASTARFAGDLPYTVAEAEARMHRFLDRVDDTVVADGLVDVLPGRDRPRSAALVATGAPDTLDLVRDGVSTVVLATGYRPHHPWLRVPVTDRSGALLQHRGVTPVPGLYTVGQRFQHRRDSGFVDGARHDARAVVDHLLTRSVRGGDLGARARTSRLAG